eukprot:TRINITY_DN66173_c0_g1_i1.p1 TRINITY_DN66173_c0_g1~~TRINITY_DN66173_c0_g1_i1.p1  ORF type:complete len:423 (+),score=107.55 TRINITY_DN66173_c0_g1_i1:73-1269(+)
MGLAELRKLVEEADDYYERFSALFVAPSGVLLHPVSYNPEGDELLCLEEPAAGADRLCGSPGECEERGHIGGPQSVSCWLRHGGLYAGDGQGPSAALPEGLPRAASPAAPPAAGKRRRSPSPRPPRPAQPFRQHIAELLRRQPLYRPKRSPDSASGGGRGARGARGGGRGRGGRGRGSAAAAKPAREKKSGAAPKRRRRSPGAAAAAAAAASDDIADMFGTAAPPPPPDAERELIAGARALGGTPEAAVSALGRTALRELTPLEARVLFPALASCSPANLHTFEAKRPQLFGEPAMRHMVRELRRMERNAPGAVRAVLSAEACGQLSPEVLKELRAAYATHQWLPTSTELQACWRVIAAPVFTSASHRNMWNKVDEWCAKARKAAAKEQPQPAVERLA